MLLFAALTVIAVPCSAGETTANAETLIRLKVQPAPAPTPALRYLLLPELSEMNPGNPIQNYLKCFMDQQKFFFDKEAFDRRQKLLAMPLKELPARELQEYGGLALSQADWAARLDNPDWQVLTKLKTEGYRVLLPDVQQLRTLGRALEGALACRGRPGPVRPGHPDRQDDVRDGPPPGRPPDVHRQRRRHFDRNLRDRAARRDAPAAGLSQPLLGTRQSARLRSSRSKRRGKASG